MRPSLAPPSLAREALRGKSGGAGHRASADRSGPDAPCHILFGCGEVAGRCVHHRARPLRPEEKSRTSRASAQDALAGTGRPYGTISFGVAVSAELILICGHHVVIPGPSGLSGGAEHAPPLPEGPPPDREQHGDTSRKKFVLRSCPQGPAQVGERLAVDLRDAPFSEIQNFSDLAQGQLLMVVEGHHQPLALGQLLNGRG